MNETAPERGDLLKRQRARTIVIAAVLTVAVAGVLLFFVLRPAPEADLGPVEPVPVPVPEEEAEPVIVDLFFPGDDGFLYPEPRELTASVDAEAAVTRLVEALLLGPEDPVLLPLLGAGVTVGRVHVMGDATVFLDLEAADGAPPPPMGSLGELLTVYGLVSTVVLNVEAAERVVLLWNGRQRGTFAGHVDTTRPLVVHSELIAPSFAPMSPAESF